MSLEDFAKSKKDVEMSVLDVLKSVYANSEGET